jgi:hypothetical protein
MNPYSFTLAIGAVFKLRRGQLAGDSRRRSLKTEQRMTRAHCSRRVPWGQPLMDAGPVDI